MLVGVSPASAATEVGDNCLATSTLGSNFTAFESAKGEGNSLPLVAPTGGIVTAWRVNSKVPAEFIEQLKVLRPTGNPKTFQTVAESSTGNVEFGQNTFAARIPVQAGDRFAAAAGPSTPIVYCPSADSSDEMSYTPSNVAVGSANEYATSSSVRIAITAVIEPDADGDGYGDETQDKCPRSAAIQAIECPVIALGTYGLANKGSALVLASASSQSTVSVSGTVKIPKSGKKKAKTVTIFGGSKPVGPGQVIPFTLAYSANLKAALASLPKAKKLTMLVSATTTDLAGQLSQSQVSLKIKGQRKKAKPKKKSKN